MGLLTGGLSYRRYRVFKPVPKDFRDRYLEAVERNIHRENLKSRSKEPVMGWVSVFNPDDTDFDLTKFLFDHYLVLTMRMDKKAVQSKLFNILLERQYAQVKEERGLERLGKNHKNEIKEALEEELLSQTLPSVNAYDVAWDFNTGEILVFATSEAINEYIRGLFHDTFQLRLYPDRMVDGLAKYLDWSEIEERTQGYIPGGSAAGGMAAEANEDGWHEHDPLDGRELLLGTEFLTWLWHQSELNDGQFTLPSDKKPIDENTIGGPVTYRDASELDLPEGHPAQEPEAPQSDSEDIILWLDNKMIFKNLEEEQPGVTMMSGQAPSSTPEARLTLEQGKAPVEARIGLRRGEYDWFFTLKAVPGGIDIGGLKIPTEVKDGDEEKIYERMYLFEVVNEAMQKLFCQYFLERTSESWGETFNAWKEDDRA